MAKDPMTEKAAILQQPVISIRISDELRTRLETLKEIMAAKSGEPVSTSEAAKQLLESSKEERLEFVNLLSEPTDSLVKIRGKADAKLPLSQAEWTLIAYYCQQGAELFANTGQTDISYESLAGILDIVRICHQFNGHTFEISVEGARGLERALSRAQVHQVQ